MQKVLILVLTAVAVYSYDDFESRENQSCDQVFCALGKECVMKNKEPVCECIERCQGPLKPVCGSDGANLTSYDSECHLYKAGCEKENGTITMVAEMSCDKVTQGDHKISEELEKDDKKTKPVVCREKHRNSIRLAIIEWISKKTKVDVEGMSYKGLLMKYFLSLDADNDQALDTMEFMKLLDEDASITMALEHNHKNPILNGLCSTELIAITDKNSDYKLEFEEFRNCLDPEFEPPKEKCELHRVQFEDGEDIPTECDNICKCACGHWVCTHNPCKKGSKNGNRAEDILSQVTVN